jgi:hypothetical protein
VITGRALAFSDPEIIRMAREDFIPVALDDWYQRRRQDAEGTFFKKVYSQDASRAAPDRPNRQGIYCLTASGKLLGVKNAGQLVDVTRDLMRQALSKWEALPEEERSAGAVKVPPMKYPDERFVPARPPQGTLILDVFTRVFDFDAQGEPQKGRSTTAGADWAAREKLWIFEPEWKALVPADVKAGDSVPVPPSLVHRLVSYHLRDNTTGQSPGWERSQIRSREMRIAVDEVGAATVKLRLQGSAAMATDADLTKAQRGIELELLGFLTYDLAKKTFARFDVVALGQTWGRGTDNGDERTVPRPIGFAMQLSSGSPYDVIAPDLMKLRQAYVNGE